MLKIQLIDLAKKFLTGGGYASPDLRQTYDDRVIAKHLSLAFDTYFNLSTTQRDEMADELGQSFWRYDQMTKRFYQPILKDTVSGTFYSELPVEIMSVNNNNGIRQISPSKEISSAFFPRKTIGNFLLNDMDVNTLGLIYYTLEGRKIWYSGEINSCWETVMMRLAVKFDELEDDDPIQMPDGDSAKIFQLMLSFMSGKLPQDKVDDSITLQNTK